MASAGIVLAYSCPFGLLFKELDRYRQHEPKLTANGVRLSGCAVLFKLTRHSQMRFRSKHVSPSSKLSAPMHGPWFEFEPAISPPR